MLAAIGETLEKEGDDEVMGVVVNARKGFYRIGLWTKTCSNQEVLKAIGYDSASPIVCMRIDRAGNVSRKFLNSLILKRLSSMLILIPKEQEAHLVRRRKCQSKRK